MNILDVSKEIQKVPMGSNTSCDNNDVEATYAHLTCSI